MKLHPLGDSNLHPLRPQLSTVTTQPLDAFRRFLCKSQGIHKNNSVCKCSVTRYVQLKFDPRCVLTDNFSAQHYDFQIPSFETKEKNELPSLL